MTLQEVKQQLAAKRLTLSAWAVANGYHPGTVRSAVIHSDKPGEYAFQRNEILAKLRHTLAEGPMPHEPAKIE